MIQPYGPKKVEILAALASSSEGMTTAGIAKATGLTVSDVAAAMIRLRAAHPRRVYIKQWIRRRGPPCAVYLTGDRRDAVRPESDREMPPVDAWAFA